MSKNLIICPTCAMHGRKEVLGALDPLGYLVVMRFHQGYTKVISNTYQVECGRCQAIVFGTTREEAYGTINCL